MRFNLTGTSPHALLRLAIKDACRGYTSATNSQEADAVITLEELQANILEQLDGSLNEKEKDFITLDFLKGELKNNHLMETLFTTDDGTQEVWFLKKAVNK